MHNQHYISLLLWWDVDTKALKNKTCIPLSQSVAILFPQFEQNLLVSCLLYPQFEQNVLFTFCLPTKMARTCSLHPWCIFRKLDLVPYDYLVLFSIYEWSLQFVSNWKSCFRVQRGVLKLGVSFGIRSGVLEFGVRVSNLEWTFRIEWPFRIRSELLELRVNM